MGEAWFRKWITLAPLGLAMSGMGATITAAAAARKERGKSWFWLGTLGLCCLNGGIAIFGEAVKARVMYDLTAVEDTTAVTA